MSYRRKDENRSATYFLMIVFSLIGAALLGYGIYSGLSIAEQTKEYEQIRGKVVDWEKEYDEDAGTLYSAIYEYEVDGNYYTIVQDSASNFKPKIGKEVKIKYNPENPSNAFVQSGATYKMFIFIGIIFLLVDGLTIYMYFGKANGPAAPIWFGLIFVAVGAGIPLILEWGLSLLTLVLQLFTIAGLFAMYQGVKSIFK